MDLFGRTLTGSADILSGYKISTIEITDKTFLSKGADKYQKTLVTSDNKSDKVSGIALEVTRSELWIADQYEPCNYKRVKVRLDSGNEAWIYITIENNEQEKL